MFIILIVANLVNIFANWVLVFGHFGFSSMGVHGSGLSTCIARTFMFVVLAAYVVWRDKKQNLGLLQIRRQLDFAKMREVIALGLPSAGQLLLEVGVFATATLLAGRLGAVPLSAHQIVLHIASITFMVPLGLSGAVAVRLGQSLGHGDFDRAANIGWLSILFGGLGGAIFALSVFALSDTLLRVFTNDVEIIQLGASLLLVAALFQISDGVQVVGTGVLRGIGNTSTSLYVNFVGHWLVGLPIGAFLCFGLQLGVQGLWIGLSVGLTFVAVVLSLYWKTQVPRVLRGEIRNVEVKPAH